MVPNMVPNVHAKQRTQGHFEINGMGCLVWVDMWHHYWYMGGLIIICAPLKDNTIIYLLPAASAADLSELEGRLIRRI